MEARVLQRVNFGQGPNAITSSEDHDVDWGVSNMSLEERYRNPLHGFAVFTDKIIPVGTIVTVLMNSVGTVPVVIRPRVTSFYGESVHRLSVQSLRSTLTSRMPSICAWSRQIKEEHFCVITEHIPYRHGVKYVLQPLGSGIAKQFRMKVQHVASLRKSDDLRSALSDDVLLHLLCKHNLLMIVDRLVMHFMSTRSPVTNFTIYDVNRVIFRDSVSDSSIEELYAEMSRNPNGTAAKWWSNRGTVDEAKLRRKGLIDLQAYWDAVPRKINTGFLELSAQQSDTWLNTLQLTPPPRVVSRADVYRVFTFPGPYDPLPIKISVFLEQCLHEHVHEGHLLQLRVEDMTPDRYPERPFLFMYAYLVKRVDQFRFLAQTWNSRFDIRDDMLVLVDTRSTVDIPTDFTPNADIAHLAATTGDDSEASEDTASEEIVERLPLDGVSVNHLFMRE